MRENARLAFEWDVENYEKDEPDRAEYTRRTQERRAQLANSSMFVKYIWTYEQSFKKFISFCITLFMVNKGKDNANIYLKT